MQQFHPAMNTIPPPAELCRAICMRTPAAPPPTAAQVLVGSACVRVTAAAALTALWSVARDASRREPAAASLTAAPLDTHATVSL
jgi:hypothetical protein